MSKFLPANMERWRNEVKAAAGVEDIAAMICAIDGVKIPLLGLPGDMIGDATGDAAAPRILPPDKGMMLIQEHDPNMKGVKDVKDVKDVKNVKDVIAAIHDDLAHGVSGIRLTTKNRAKNAARGDVIKILEACAGQKPVFYLDGQMDEIGAICAAAEKLNIPLCLEMLPQIQMQTQIKKMPEGFTHYLIKTEADKPAAEELADALLGGIGLIKATGRIRSMNVCVALKADAHIFMTIAKYRAARWLWAEIAKIYGGSALLSIHGAAPSAQGGEDSPIPHGGEDSWRHILHNAAACFAAASGGAQSLTLTPHISGDHHAQRIARNIWHVLREEGHLGRVRDPAAGSWLAENLTMQLAKMAWGHLQKAASELRDVELQRPADMIAESTAALTPEKIEVKSVYAPDDLPAMEQTLPGQPPFTRGPYAAMFLTRAWTIRQYAGFSTAEDSNEFYRHALAHGQKGLSVAFDLPTHRGYDSDDEHAAQDVGMAGVAIDCLDDMRILFDKIPLDEVSVSMTMNGAVLPIMALYIAAASEQGVAPEQLAGTIQNDILKEFMVRNTYIYPPAPSMRIVSDIFAYAAQHMPKFNTISISGYHMQEAGATKDLELAYTLADGMEYVRAGMKAGLDIDDFAPRLSFFWCIGMDFFMEVAKLRAARMMWAQIMKNFGARKEKALALRAHSQTSGWSLTARDPFNNIARTCLEAAAAIYGGTQSLHTNALDEALALPSQFSAKIARETQLFLQKETDMTKAIDAWGGSYYVERLTQDIMSRAQNHIDEIEAEGGMVAALAKGLPKMRIEEAAIRAQAHIDAGQRVIVGVNKFHAKDEPDIDILKVDNIAVRNNQLARLKAARAKRDAAQCQSKLEALYQAARGQDNLLAASVEAAKAGATVGEMSEALERVFSRHQAQPRITKGIYANTATSGTTASGTAAGRKVRHAREIADDFQRRHGYRPRILVAKAGQDGHDRGQKVIAGAYADMGFDVSVGALFQTAQEVAARAIEQDVHIVAISSLAGAHMKLARGIVQELDDRDRGDIIVVAGGIIPKDDIAPLKEAGVKAVYLPGADVSASAIDLLELIRGKN